LLHHTYYDSRTFFCSRGNRNVYPEAQFQFEIRISMRCVQERLFVLMQFEKAHLNLWMWPKFEVRFPLRWVQERLHKKGHLKQHMIIHESDPLKYLFHCETCKKGCMHRSSLWHSIDWSMNLFQIWSAYSLQCLQESFLPNTLLWNSIIMLTHKTGRNLECLFHSNVCKKDFIRKHWLWKLWWPMNMIQILRAYFTVMCARKGSVGKAV